MLKSNAESPSNEAIPRPRPHSHNLDLALIVLIITINSAAFIYQADHNLDVRADVHELRSQLQQLVDRTQAPSDDSDFAAILPTPPGANLEDPPKCGRRRSAPTSPPGPHRPGAPLAEQLARQISGSTPDPTN